MNRNERIKVKPQKSKPTDGRKLRGRASPGIVDAIQKAIAEDNWLRPESWKGTGQALTVENGRLFFVPTHRGGKLATMPTTAELCGVWEVISANVVNNERT
jgi:hypothetical protein